MTTASPHGATHAVLNQVPPFEDVNLFETNAALRDAVKFNAPALATDSLAHARRAGRQRARCSSTRGWPTCIAPALHTHDRFGHRIDEVEFHPSYHVLLGAALQHRLHGAPWAADGPSHVERAAGFMLFTELEPSVLCPVSMTYAVAPALRANAALQHTFARPARRARATTRASSSPAPRRR